MQQCQLAGGQPVDGGDFGCQGAQAGGLNVLLVRLLFKVRVVVAGHRELSAHVIDGLCLGQHARIGSRQTGDREQARNRRRHENVGVAHGDRDSIDRAVLSSRDVDNVPLA